VTADRLLLVENRQRYRHEVLDSSVDPCLWCSMVFTAPCIGMERSFAMRLIQGLGSCNVLFSVSSRTQNGSSRSRPERYRACTGEKWCKKAKSSNVLGIQRVTTLHGATVFYDSATISVKSSTTAQCLIANSPRSRQTAGTKGCHSPQCIQSLRIEFRHCHCTHCTVYDKINTAVLSLSLIASI